MNHVDKIIPSELKDYIVIDLETTGLSEINNEILQIAIIRVRNNDVVDTFSSYVKPLFHKDWPAARKINNITPEMVKDAPLWKDIRQDVLNFMGDDIIMGYNVGFDLKFIDSWFEEYEYTYTQEDIDYIRSRAEAPVTPGVLSERTKNRHIKELETIYVGYKETRYAYYRGGDVGIQINEMRAWYDYVDVLSMARAKQFTSCTLENLVKELNIEVEDSMHNALTDILATKALFDILKTDYKDSSTVRDKEFKNKLAELNEQRVDVDNSLNGKTVVVTGTLSMVRIEFLDILSKHGAIVANSVTKKTDYLIIGKDVGKGKTDKAAKYGVPVLTEEQVCKMIGI